MHAGCVLFRVDAAPGIGLGHLQRCHSLAMALHQLGTPTLFLTNKDVTGQGRIPLSQAKTHALDDVDLGTPRDLEETVAIATRHNCDAVVVDSYLVNADYLGILRREGFFVVAIDDLARYPFPCQLVVSGNADSPWLPYTSSSGDTRFLLGPQYALVRAELWDVPERMVNKTVQNVLLTVGGADSHNLMPELLHLLDQISGDFTLTAIVGPFFENRGEVQAAARRCQRAVRMVENPDSVRDLMLAADLAVSGGGQTLYELAATGTPAVAVQMADNQCGSLSAMAGRGVVRVAGCIGDTGLLPSVKVEVERLLGDVEARRKMSKAGQCLGTGRGAILVAEVFTSLRSKGRG